MIFLKNIILLLISPGEGWKDIGKYTIPNNLLLGKLFYPSIGILALTSFIPYILGYINLSMQNVIIAAMIDFVKFFISMFAISYFVTGFYSDLFKKKTEINKINNFIVYNLTILVVFNILRILMPGFPFFDIFPLYIIYVVYRGLSYLNIPDARKKGFVSIVSLLLLIVPNGIKLILELLIPNP